jgi:acyl transferase domain-containing protein
MEPCDQEVAAALADLRPRPTAVPMVSTVTGALAAGTDLGGLYWARNVREPVRFAAAVAAISDLTGQAGSEIFLEIGPHPVLSVAVAQTLEPAGREAAVFASLRRGRDERETLLETLGGLWVLGVPVDWSGVHPDGGRHVRLPSYPFQRQRHWFTAAEPEGTKGTAEAAVTVGTPPADPEPAAVERLLADQLDAFNRMVALQLDLLGRAGSI